MPEKEWIQEDQASYLTHNAGSGSWAQIKAVLDNTAKIRMLTKTDVDYLIGSQSPEDISRNRVQWNGWDYTVRLGQAPVW